MGICGIKLRRSPWRRQHSEGKDFRFLPSSPACRETRRIGIRNWRDIFLTGLAALATLVAGAAKGAEPSARGDVKIDLAYGKLRDAALYLLNLIRAFNGQSDGVYPQRVSGNLLQNVYYSASVFNYYAPDYTVPTTTARGPEFAIQNTSTALTRINRANTMIFSSQIAPDATVAGATGASLSMAALQALANAGDGRDARCAAAARHDVEREKGAIVTAVNAIPASDPLNRARTAA